MTDSNSETLYFLVNEAVVEAQKRNKAKAKVLMDQAISTAENSDLAFALRVLRERLLLENYHDLPRLIEALNAQLSFYQAIGCITGQIDTLRNLATESAVLGNKLESLNYLNLAEQILSNLGEDHLLQISTEMKVRNPAAGREFVRTRAAMIRRTRDAVSKSP